MEKANISFWACLWRGLRLRCAHCGRGKLFKGFYHLNHQCSACGENLQKDAIDTLGLMYISTAFLTGVGVFLMFWVLPLDSRVGRIGAAFLMIFFIIATLPVRKGLALALTYYMEKVWQ